MAQEKLFAELVDDIGTTLQLAFDRIGALRDAVPHGAEKDIFNKSRGALQDLVGSWRRYYTGLPADRANEKMGTGWKNQCKWPEDDNR